MITPLSYPGRLIVSAFLFTVAVTGSTEEQPPENTEYFHACSSGDLSIVTSLLEADPALVHTTTRDGEHCLHLSALSGNADIVKLLLEKGADPDIRSTYDKGLRMHPLSWCTYYGRHEIISLLLQYGADVNADFDLGGEFEEEEDRVVTALDVIEKILLDMSVDDERKVEFVETRNVLVRGGALRWVSLKDEL